MAISFRRTEDPRWIDTPDFAWVPDEPFDFVPSNDAMAEPQAAVPAPEPSAPEPRAPAHPGGLPQDAADLGDLAALGAFSPAAKSLFTGPDLVAAMSHVRQEPDAVMADEPAPPPDAPAAPRFARLARLIPPQLLGPRLLIGFGQGLGLCLLLLARGAGAIDPYLFSALALALLPAPLVLLEGLGEVAPVLLLPWTGIAASALACLGAYHHWRVQGLTQPESAFTLVPLCALMLFVAQALMRVWLSERGHKRAYRIAFEAAWSLAARLCIWMMLTGAAWTLLGSGNTLVTLPLMGLVSALALHITAGRALAMRQARGLLMALATVMLPLMLGVGVSLLVVHVTRTPVPAWMLLAAALLLVIGINASWRGHGARARRWPQWAAAFLILVLTAVAAVALDARVAQHGWSVLRVYGGAATIVLACYGILYGGAALVSLGGGRWMRSVEPANFIMAVVVILGCVALTTPIADPARIAVDSQTQRLESGAADPVLFDFGYLERSGLRFGHAALTRMANAPGFSAQVAGGAALALANPPVCRPGIMAAGDPAAALPGWRDITTVGAWLGLARAPAFGACGQ
jgi:hypothetical protein